jgi:hypothetical protein
MSDVKLDAGESIFFTRELEKIRVKSYDVKFKEAKLLNIIPWSTDGDPYIDTITHRSFTRVGMAKMGGGQYATDFPRVDVYGTEVSVKSKPVHSSYGYNTDEIHAAAKANKPLESMRANAARKAVDMKLDEIAVQGEASTGLNGLFNHPDISEYIVPATGTGTKTNWGTKTSDQILADLNGIVNYVIVATAGIETPDTLALPLTSYNIITQKRLSDYDDKSILKYFLENNPYIKRVEWFTELESMGDAGDTTKRFVVWANDPDHLVLDMPMPFQQEATLQDGLAFVVPCRAKTAGVTFFYPKSACFGDGI